MSKQHHKRSEEKGRRVIRMKRLREKYPYSESSIYDQIKKGLFPAPFALIQGGRARGWFEDEIDEYLAARATSEKGGRDD
jgi:predicted DNA-binding transcriptional regulator AlpA